MNKKELKYTALEIGRELQKSLYKALCKTLKNKNTTQTIVADILDQNNEPVVAPDKLPATKQAVMEKTKDSRFTVEQPTSDRLGNYTKNVKRKVAPKHVKPQQPTGKTKYSVKRIKGVKKLRTFLDK